MFILLEFNDVWALLELGAGKKRLGLPAVVEEELRATLKTFLAKFEFAANFKTIPLEIITPKIR